MSYLNKPVAYLQDSDFDATGNLVNPAIPKDVPVVLMIQANFCGHCTHAKPAFQQFADENKGKVFACTVQGDGSETGEKELGKRLSKLFPDFVGFPHYVGYKGGKFVKTHTGARSKDALVAFASSL